jgi:hypothetical protein
MHGQSPPFSFFQQSDRTIHLDIISNYALLLQLYDSNMAEGPHQGVASPRRMKDRNDRGIARCSPPSGPIARLNNLQYGRCWCLRMIGCHNELSIFFIIDADFLSLCSVSVNVPFVHSIRYSYTFKELTLVGVSQLKIASFRITRPSCNSLASVSRSS